MVGDPLPELARRGMTDGFDPGPRIEIRAVVTALRQDHDIVGRVVEIDDSHASQRIDTSRRTAGYRDGGKSAARRSQAG